jgi:hypothetical protein
MENKNEVTLTFSKKGLCIYAGLLVFCDILSTFLVAKTSLNAFLQFEVNPFMKWAFLHLGWWSFVAYPIVPFILYIALISAGFGIYSYFSKKGQGKIVKGYFYFLITYLSFHFMVIVNNLILYYTLTCR